MERYTKEPVDIMAVKYEDGAQVADILDQVNRGDGSAKLAGDGEAIVIETLEGAMRLEKGNWLIQGVEGEFYPCRDDIFQSTYRRAGNESRRMIDMAKLHQAVHYLERAPGLLRQMAPSLRLEKVGVEEALAILRALCGEEGSETQPGTTSLGAGMPAARRQ